ncbi:hypothetical protein JCM10207_004351 [Rhodosporidiobolus poonsookiae]
MATFFGGQTQYCSIPQTQLPSDPKALARYLRSQQLAALRHLYEHKTQTVTQQYEERAASLRGRHGRARRRRGSSPLDGGPDGEAEDEEDELEVRKRMRYDPSDEEEGEEPAEQPPAASAEQGDAAAPVPAKKPRRARQPDETAVDPSHTYDLVFDLAPDNSADAYYHGPHPPPPARVVRTVLRATKYKPFIDPEGLSAAQLQTLTSRLWEEEGKGLSIFFGEENGKKRAEQPLSRDQERYQREVNAEAADEWEASVIAGFSAACDEKIGRTMARKPLTAREMQAQAQAQLAQQQQQQQAHPGAEASPYPAQPAAPYWR